MDCECEEETIQKRQSKKNILNWYCTNKETGNRLRELRPIRVLLREGRSDWGPWYSS